MKRKVNVNRPELSSEEIVKRKDFNSVLKHSSIVNQTFLKKPWFLSSVVIVAAVVSTVLLLNNKNPATINQQLTTNKDSIALADFYKKEEAKPCISPPLKNINIEYTTYKVIAEKGATLDFKTGSKLVVPKNAFADDKGKLLKGEVELRYREFHDAVDFFVSGIPMTYDSAGIKYQFESAGMIEMLAYQDGKQVNMAANKSINVEMESKYKGTEYNLYKLDTVHNNWSCLGKDKVVSETNSFAIKDTIQRPSLQLTPEYKKIETKKEVVIKEKENAIAALPKPAQKPNKPLQVNKEKHTFDIAVEPSEFPELAIYKGVLFEIGDENKDFSRSLYDITWDDASLKDGTQKGKNYLLTLKKGTKKYELIVYPVFEGKNYEVAMKDYQDKYSKYTAVLDKRKADEKRIEEEYEAKLLALKKQQEELERKWKEQQANQFKQMDTQEKVKRMFAINSFGVFNSDCGKSYPQGVLCTANLTKDKKVKLMCYDIYLVDKARNSLFTYYKNPVAQFSFNPQSTNILWAVEDGVLYWLKPEQFKDIKGSDGMANLKMNRVNQKFSTVEEVKACLSF